MGEREEGQIPKPAAYPHLTSLSHRSLGPVCAQFLKVLWFQSFCEFTRYRCINRKYYSKVQSGIRDRAGGAISWETEGGRRRRKGR